MLADTNASAVVVDDAKLLEGLSEGDIAAASQKAKDRGLDGKWVLTLSNTTRQPVVASIQNRDLREKVLEASSMRCDHGGETDTTAIVAHLAQLRSQKAKLLGFSTFAAYSLERSDGEDA